HGVVFFYLLRLYLLSILFPYTTLFRSRIYDRLATTLYLELLCFCYLRFTSFVSNIADTKAFRGKGLRGTRNLSLRPYSSVPKRIENYFVTHQQIRKQSFRQ